MCRTDPLDVARVEGRTFVVTDDKYESVPHVKEGVKGILGNWMSPEQMKQEMKERLPGCMKGTTFNYNFRNIFQSFNTGNHTSH